MHVLIALAAMLITNACAPHMARTSLNIFTGVPAKSGSYPWAVTIYEGGTLTCGGSIISPTRILTAGHCVAYRSPTEIQVRAGGNLLEKHVILPSVAEILPHENYQLPIDSIPNDIALLILSEPITFGTNISQIDLPDETYSLPDAQDQYSPPSGVGFGVAGWGATELGPYSNTLLELTDLHLLPLAANPIWRDAAHENLIKSTDYVPQVDLYENFRSGGYLAFRAVETNESIKGFCIGDSGSGLVDFARNFLIGVVSHGSHVDCAESKIMYFTDVTHHLNWILDNL